MPKLPPTTKYLMLACVAVFCLSELLTSARLGAQTPIGVRPILEAWFALFPLDSGNFMPWQLVSYAFLHGDFGHLFFNMLGLWMFGAELENLWGRKRYLQFLGVSVVTAALAQLLVTSLTGSLAPTIGASGAIYGLLLAYALSFPRRYFDLVGFLPMALLMVPSQTLNIIGVVLYVMLVTNRQAVPIPPMPVKALVMVAIFGAIELFTGLMRSSSIAHFAHLGGMVGAWLMIRFWRGQSPFSLHSRRRR